ncbi:MAG: GNAT family N-acetyltransferase [Anaerolineae bacterium]|nr:GNAT family N-acetyltransferase [Anaerolineae bacterium]
MKTNSQQTITSHAYQCDKDGERIPQFLIDTYTLTGYSWNWDVRRWAGHRYYGHFRQSWRRSDYVRVWENKAGEIVGVVHNEGDVPYNPWVEIHPDYRHLEDEMIAWAESAYTGRKKDGKRTLEIFVFEEDTHRQSVLADRGWAKTEHSEVIRRMPYAPLEEPVTIPEGYKLRSLVPGEADAANWVTITRRVFQPDCDLTALDSGPYRVFQEESPWYQHDLHIVAETPDGSLAAFAGFSVEPTNHMASLEPVGTHPDHRRRGLASAVIREGLRRLAAYDVEVVYVGTGGDMLPANKLYESLGFTDVKRLVMWTKHLASS